MFNQRGSSPFPYYRESVHGTVVTTNLDTGGTYTNVFTANSRDHTIVDNGDGTITITVFASGGSRFMTPTASSCSRTPARPGSPSTSTTTALPVTPATTSRSPTSFRVVRGSTGNSDLSDRDFCADLQEFTS